MIRKFLRGVTCESEAPKYLRLNILSQERDCSLQKNIYIIANVNRNIQIFHLRRDLQNNIYTIENVNKSILSLEIYCSNTKEYLHHRKY